LYYGSARRQEPKQRHNLGSECCIKQSMFQQQYTRHNAVKCTDMEIANLVSLSHGGPMKDQDGVLVKNQRAKIRLIPLVMNGIPVKNRGKQ
jgi:hypothetical protein